MPTTCARSSACSSAIRWCRRRSSVSPRPRAKAGSCRKRCGCPAPTAARRAGCVSACGRCRQTGAYARWTAWSVSDVTRDRDRQENFFLELRDAIDYPRSCAGRVLLGRSGRERQLPQCNACGLARLRSRAGRLGRSEARRHRGGRRRGAARAGRAASRATSRPRCTTRPEDARGQDRPGPSLPQGRVRGGRHARRLAHAGAQSRARGSGRPGARGRSALRALLPQHPDGDRDRRQGRQDRARQCAVRAAAARRHQGRCAAGGGPLDPHRRRRARIAPRSKPRSRKAADGQGDIAPVDGALAGEGNRSARFYVSAVDESEAGRRGRDRLHDRDHRGARAGKAGRAGAEDGHGRPASPAASRTTSTMCSPPS